MWILSHPLWHSSVIYINPFCLSLLCFGLHVFTFSATYILWFLDRGLTCFPMFVCRPRLLLTAQSPSSHAVCELSIQKVVFQLGFDLEWRICRSQLFSVLAERVYWPHVSDPQHVTPRQDKTNYGVSMIDLERAEMNVPVGNGSSFTCVVCRLMPPCHQGHHHYFSSAATYNPSYRYLSGLVHLNSM